METGLLLTDDSGAHDDPALSVSDQERLYSITHDALASYSGLEGSSENSNVRMSTKSMALISTSAKRYPLPSALQQADKAMCHTQRHSHAVTRSTEEGEQVAKDTGHALAGYAADVEAVGVELVCVVAPDLLAAVDVHNR